MSDRFMFLSFSIYCSNLLLALISILASTNTLTSAFGQTTVPISLPSSTEPPSWNANSLWYSKRYFLRFLFLSHYISLDAQYFCFVLRFRVCMLICLRIGVLGSVSTCYQTLPLVRNCGVRSRFRRCRRVCA